MFSLNEYAWQYSGTNNKTLYKYNRFTRNSMVIFLQRVTYIPRQRRWFERYTST